MPKVVTVFQQRYPAVHLTLMTLSEVDQAEAIEQGRVHAGYSTPPIGMKGDGVSEHPNRWSSPCRKATPPRQATIPIAALADEDWLMPDRRTAPSSHFMLNSFCTEAGFTPRVVQCCPAAASPSCPSTRHCCASSSASPTAAAGRPAWCRRSSTWRGRRSATHGGFDLRSAGAFRPCSEWLPYITSIKLYGFGLVT
ncbi:MAG: hypothetical protein JOY64_35530 [Alphaproteobacteria bacterium]|nr:hypothetical protein [Alphaproteobacteria bacterium]